MADPNLLNNTNAAVVAVTPLADLAVGKVANVAGAYAGGNVTYTISVTNLGPSVAGGVVVTDALPAGVGFVGASGNGTTNGHAAVATWDLSAAALAVGQVTNVSLTVGLPANAPAVGAVTNVAYAGPTNGPPSPSPQVPVLVTNLADLQVTNIAPGSVVAGQSYTNVISVTNAGPSVATNVLVVDVLPGGGTTNINVGTLPAGGVTNISIVSVAPGGGPLTNTASAGSPVADPNLLNNTNAAVTGVTNFGPVADVQVFVSGPTNVTVGDGFSYTILVTNAGPNTAVNTLVTNLLPTNLVFASTSGGGINTNNIITWPVIPSLTNGQATNFVLTVTPVAGVSTVTTNTNPFNFVETNTTPSVGFLTNKASAFAVTFDPNLTNNSASSAYTNAQVQTVIVPGVFSIFISTNTYPTNGLQGIITNTIIPIGNGLFIVGTSAWNPETQLYEETVTVTNLGTATVYSLRVYVGHLRSGVTLYNATGTNNIGTYVEYDPPSATPLIPGNSVTFLLEFYVTDGQPFTNSLTAVAALTTPPPVIGVQPVTIIVPNVPDTRDPNNRYLIQFATIPGRTYTIEYKDSLNPLVPWNIAVPSIVASSTSTLWYDDGPPETLSKPGGSRFYRVFLDP